MFNICLLEKIKPSYVTKDPIKTFQDDSGIPSIKERRRVKEGDDHLKSSVDVEHVSFGKD